MEMTMKKPSLNLIQWVRRYLQSKTQLVWLNFAYYLGFGLSVYFDEQSKAGVLSVLPIGWITTAWIGIALLIGALMFAVGQGRNWYGIAVLTYLPYLAVSLIYWYETGSRQATFVHTFALFAAWIFAQLQEYRGDDYE